MKECIACAEEIKGNAKLCKHCGTSQDDSRFLTNSLTESSNARALPVGLVERLDRYALLLAEFGPFEWIGHPDDIQDEILSVDGNLLWTEREPSDTVITNGVFHTDDVVGVYRSHRPWVLDEGAIIVASVLSFECDACHGDGDEGCIDCAGSGLIVLDLDEIASRRTIDPNDASAIWSQRVPGGHFGEICVPDDYDSTAHSRTLPRPSWLR